MSPVKPDPTALAVAALATYRLTVLVTADKVTEPLRDAVGHALDERRHGPRPSDTADAAYAGDDWDRLAAIDPHPLTYLLSCPWCASPYIALPIVAAAVLRRPGRVWWLTMGVAAASGAASALASRVAP